MNIKDNWNMNKFIEELEKSGLEKDSDYEIENAVDNKIIIKLNSEKAFHEINSNQGNDYIPSDHKNEYDNMRINKDQNNIIPENDFRNIYTKIDFNKPNDEVGSVSIFSSDYNDKIVKGIAIYNSTELKCFYTENEPEFKELQSDLNELKQLKIDSKENNILKPTEYEENWDMDSFIEKLENSSLEKGKDYNIIQTKDNKLTVEAFTGDTALELSSKEGHYNHYYNRKGGDENGLKFVQNEVNKELNDYGERRMFFVMDFDKKYTDHTASTQIKVDGKGDITYVVGRNGKPLGYDAEEQSLRLDEEIKELKDNLNHHLHNPTIDFIKRKAKHSNNQIVDLESGRDIEKIYLDFNKIDIKLNIEEIKASKEIKTPEFFKDLPKDQKEIKLTDFPEMKKIINEQGLMNSYSTEHLLSRLSDEGAKIFLSNSETMQKVVQTEPDLKNLSNDTRLMIQKSPEYFKHATKSLIQKPISKQNNECLDNDIDISMQNSLKKLQEENAIHDNSLDNKKEVSQNRTIKSRNKIS